ncbi:MAG: hypothetical protein ACXWCM_10570 [Acidimicrobiales bacterium]
MSPERLRTSYFICRDGLRWQFYAESDRGSEEGWRLTERGAKRAARRRIRKARSSGAGHGSPHR